MCGRFALYTPPSRIASLFGARLADSVDPASPPRWNVSPASVVYGMTERVTPEGDELVLDRYRWGLVPPWAPDKSRATTGRLFNARSETAATRPSFRAAFMSRRVVVVADGFFEWQKGPGSRSGPHYFSRADGDLLAFAGLWEPGGRTPPESAQKSDMSTCTILTTSAGTDMAGIHDRMPVVLERDVLGVWLDPAQPAGPELQSVLGPAPSGTLVHHRVDPRVGNVRNDDPGVIAAVDENGNGR
ncbi:MAG: SOS response-associated peptidase [Actinomycetota bacterium]|jgi:putative SOS response-associated peptidase YedK|nr:SOS response-associated peptidase [Actinomycetota bacterium]